MGDSQADNAREQAEDMSEKSATKDCCCGCDCHDFEYRMTTPFIEDKTVNDKPCGENNLDPKISIDERSDL